MLSNRIHKLFATTIALALSAPALGQLDILKKITETGTAATGKKIAYLRIKGDLHETPVNMPPLFAPEMPMSTLDVITSLKEARQDPEIVAVVLDLQEAQLGLGQVEELHSAMRKLAAVEKDVYLHADMMDTVHYAAASGASHISMVPTGDLFLLGIHGATPYLRGALDKLGVAPDFEHCGDFKTGADFITRTEPSENQKRMTNWLLDSLYAGMIKLIADGRSMTPDKVRALIDGGPYLAEDALKAGLIDSVQHRQDLVMTLKKRFGNNVQFVHDYGMESDFEVPDDNIFAAFEFLMKMLSPTPTEYTDPSVAVVYVEGAIMSGEEKVSPFGGSGGAFSTTIRKALDTAAEDDSVKAVVLRVDSPGGSALASEVILDATKRVARRKPLIVSMGNVAASGGYYVTCAAETVFADANTITASIGVLGGKLVTTGLWDKLGINWDHNQRGKMAGMLSTAAPFSDEERARIRKYMETIYDVFKGHVVKARKDKLTKPIDEMAGGRVYSGAQALELGLIDKIGGLDEAVAFAAKRTGASDYEIRVIPEPPTIFDLFMPKTDEQIRIRGGSFLDYAAADLGLSVIARVDPMRAKLVMQALRRLDLIQKEGVIAMMPFDLMVTSAR